ncbi:MAG: hypothetical protein L6365_04200 [Desulfobulbaceae bacterium]|nr:hypothetical protein [Pseudomonadota bacterium]MCG2746718.1 hypothetical protein [Desulfobulbaceae bacterium]
MESKHDSLDYIYKEYVRLCEICDNYTKNSYEDLRLLGSVGVFSTSLLSGIGMLFKVSPNPQAAQTGVMQQAFVKGTEIYDYISIALLFGFIGVLAIATIIGIWNLLKFSMANYFLLQLPAYEEVLRTRLDLTKTDTFRLAASWQRYYTEKHGRLVLSFRGLFVVMFFLPCFVLFWREAHLYAVIYLIILLLFSSVFLMAGKVLEN